MKKKVLKVLLLAAIVFVIYNVITFYTAPQNIVIAEPTTIENTSEYEGIIIRNESSVAMDKGEKGMFDSAVSENEMVRKGKLIALYYDSEIDEKTKKEITDINRKINEITSASVGISEGADSIAKLEERISEKTDELIKKSAQRNMTEIAELKSEIDVLLSRKYVAETDPDAAAKTLEALRAQKADIESRYGGVKKEVTSPAHGIFTTKIDGYENVLTAQKATSMTVSEFETAAKREITAEDAVKKGVVCKIIDNSKWWVSIIADEQNAKKFTVGTVVNLRFSGGNEDVKATVEYVSQPMSGKYVVTFSSIDYSEYVLTNRFASITIVENSYSGFGVPIKAIRVKNGKTGVYVQTENTVKYREIEVIYKDDKQAIVKVDNTKSNALLLYDEIIEDYK